MRTPLSTIIWPNIVFISEIQLHEHYVHSTLTKLEREERYPHPHPKHRNIPTNQTNNKQTINYQTPECPALGTELKIFYGQLTLPTHPSACTVHQWCII